MAGEALQPGEPVSLVCSFGIYLTGDTYCHLISRKTVMVYPFPCCVYGGNNIMLSDYTDYHYSVLWSWVRHFLPLGSMPSPPSSTILVFPALHHLNKQDLVMGCQTLSTRSNDLMKQLPEQKFEVFSADLFPYGDLSLKWICTKTKQLVRVLWIFNTAKKSWSWRILVVGRTNEFLPTLTLTDTPTWRRYCSLFRCHNFLLCLP